MGRHVASGAGIAIVPPCAADPVGLVEDLEIRDTLFEQLDGCADPGKTGANDEYLERLRRGHVNSPPR